jgi:oligopeptide transport system ATP-binding protein
MENNKLLDIQNLRTSFFTHVGEVKAIRGVGFSLGSGEALGIVGESGSGKSVTALSIMKLLQFPGKIVSGKIFYRGEDLSAKSERQMQNIRGNEIAMIFQDPMTSLNPVYTIGDQIMEVILNHQKVTRKEAKERAIEMLRLVGIPSPEKRIKNYPHEFSGGMRQRAMIAIALSCEPSLLIADEPTTALDVTIQAQIIDLMKDLKNKLNTSIILITHDLGVVAEVCSRIIVMYGGLIMEEGEADDIFYSPKHPYTWGLLNSIPRLDLGNKQRLVPIEGSPPDLLKPPQGCPFVDRCNHAMGICIETMPPYMEVSQNHKAACWLLHPDAPKVEYENSLKGGV